MTIAAHRARKLILSLFLIAVMSGSGCERGTTTPPAPPGTSEATTEPSAAAAPVASPPADDAAGVIQAAGGKLEYPAGSAIQSFSTVPSPPTPINANLLRVSDAFGINSARTVFAQPLKVTLNLDKAKLRADLKPEDVFPVLAVGGLTERMSKGVKVDLAGGTVTYELRRRYPLVALQATQPAGAGEPTTFIVVNDKPFYPLGPVTPDLAIYVTESRKTAAAKFEQSIRDNLATVRQKYEEMGYRRVVPLRIEITDLVGAGGQASGGDKFEVNFDTIEKFPFFFDDLFAHEYFHSIQQNYLIDALAKFDQPHAWASPLDARWVDEGSAGAMQARVCAITPVDALIGLKLNYGYRPLNSYDAATGELHEYQATAFFHYVTARYGDLRPVLEEFYSRLMFGGNTPPPPPVVHTEGSLEELLQAVDLEDGLKGDPYRAMDMALRKHFRKSLRRMFIESLMALYVRKDIEPFTSGAAKVFGPPMELRTPPEETVKINCPYRIGDSWTSERETDPQAGEGMSIISAVEVTRMTLPDQKPGALLQLDLTCPEAASPTGVVMIAFPVGADGKVGPHSVGYHKRPAVINDWETHPKAIVWLVNTTTEPRAGVRLKATTRMPSNFRIDYAPNQPRTVASNQIIVTSPALAELKSDDKRNGLRFTLYRSPKPDGPFEPVTSNRLDRNVAVDIFKGEKRSQDYLLAPDKAALIDPNVYRKDQTVQTGPFYYRIGQTMLVNNFSVKPQGEETMSNILGPGEGMIRLIPHSGTEEFEINGDWCEFTAALSSRAQNWDCTDAEFVVTAGKWTGHFRSGRFENGCQYGMADKDNKSVGSRARIRVPYRPQGTEITIAASGLGMTATQAIQLPPNAEQAAKEKEVMAKFEKAKETTAAAVAKKAEEQQQAVAAAEKAIVDYQEAKRNKQLLFGSMSELLRNLVNQQLDLKRINALRAPFPDVVAWEQLDGASRTTDPAFVLRILQQQAKRADAEHAIDIEKLKAFAGVIEEGLNNPDEKESHARYRENLTFQQKSIAEVSARPQPSQYVMLRMIPLAERTGDAVLLREAHAAQLAEIDRQMKQDPSDERRKFEKADRMREMATRIAMLTGNRTEAATLWRQADQLAGVKEDPAAKEIRYLPAWFPPGQ